MVPSSLARLFRRLRWRRTHPVADYKTIWDFYARDNARDWIFTGATEESFETTGRADAERLFPLLPEGARVLNIGCGVGRVERYLAPRVSELWGVDISGEMIELAHKRLADFPNVQLREVGPQEYLRHFRDAHFDLVFSLLVLQHMEREDAYIYLREAHRVLKPGGALYVQFPNFLSPEYTEAFLDPLDRHRSASRVRPYTGDEVGHLLRMLGFTISRMALEGGREGNAEIYVTARKAA